MGRGALQLGLALALVCLGAASSLAVGPEARLLVGEEAYQGQATLVHVSVDPPPGRDTVEIVVTASGTHGSRTVASTSSAVDGDRDLVTVTWTPARAGSYTLEAQTLADGHVVDTDEQTVEVQPAPRAASDREGGLPETAPGTVQWAIAFGILFFVARAGLGRRG